MSSNVNVRNILLGSLVGGTLLAAIFGWQHYRMVSLERTATPGERHTQAINLGYTQALPRQMKLDADKVALGRKLFHDARLSGDNSIACASCHMLDKGGADGRVHSIGIRGAEGGINSPTVFNSGFNFVQFWDGRAATLEDQIDGPIHHPKEMGSNWAQVIEKIGGDAEYRRAFSSVYGGRISAERIKDAIATFERSLVTRNSLFDRYLLGDNSAMSEEAQRGYQLFQSYGCISCHQGMNLGGNMYEKMGLMGNYFEDRGNITEADMGRYNVTHSEDHRHEFRVPSLRNVALTAPYFHDGSAETLPQAVAVMAQYQLGRSVPQKDMADIVQFLNALTGELGGSAQ
jgi:cytochrome c peroxidase